MHSVQLSKENTAALAEFIGTFLFAVTVPLAHEGVGSLAPLPTGFMLTAMIFAFGYLSGGHFNPAISFAAVTSGKLPLVQFVKYLIGQCFGALLGVLYSGTIIGRSIPAPQADELVDIWKSLCLEGAFSFAIVTVVLHTTCSRQKDNGFFGLAIGMVVLASSIAGGGYNTGAFNPAVSTALQATRCVFAVDCKPLLLVWLFWAAPFAGAFLASMAYNILDTAGIDVGGSSPAPGSQYAGGEASPVPQPPANQLADFH